MKIFIITWSDGERSFIAAHTNIEAIQKYLSITDMDLSCDFTGHEEITELNPDEWSEYFITDNENDLPQQSFEDWMKENKDPDIIAETHY